MPPCLQPCNYYSGKLTPAEPNYDIGNPKLLASSWLWKSGGTGWRELIPLHIPHRPWSHIGIDFITDLPESEGHTCILVAVDHFSKACKLIPLCRFPTALETAEQVFAHVFSLLGITMSLFSGYHPQTKAEWKIQELGRYLRAYCQEDQFGWNRFLPWVEYAKNSLRQNTTGLTPFQCMLSYQPPLFPWTGEPSEVPVVDYWF